MYDYVMLYRYKTVTSIEKTVITTYKNVRRSFSHAKCERNVNLSCIS